jgi:hypothetical protein
MINNRAAAGRLLAVHLRHRLPAEWLLSSLVMAGITAGRIFTTPYGVFRPTLILPSYRPAAAFFGPRNSRGGKSGVFMDAVVA